MNAALAEHNGGTAPGVLSCSFGGDASSDPYNAAIEACVDAGLPVVAAAGNSGRDLGATGGSLNHWPAENEDCVTVGGIDRHFRIHPRSNRYGQVDLYASYHAWTVARVGGGFRGALSWRGTSFSCPMVSGLLARMMTGTTKMTSRAEVETLRQDLMLNYTVGDVIDVSGLPLEGASRLYIPGVTLTGFAPATPPVRGLPDATPVRVDTARTHAILGSVQSGVAVRKASADMVLGSPAAGVATRSAITHVIVEP